MTTKTPSKNGKFLGRPSKYDPAYCDQVVALGKEGLSRWQIRVSRFRLLYSIHCKRANGIGHVLRLGHIEIEVGWKLASTALDSAAAEALILTGRLTPN